MIAVQTFQRYIRRPQYFTITRTFVSNISKTTMASEKIIDELKVLFSHGVSAVQPENIFCAKNISVNEKESTIDCNFNGNHVNINIDNNKRCHLVGFGKAVYGMASELSKVLGERLESGIISVPLNIHENFEDIHLPAKIKVFQGAKNNLPDADAELAASKIVEFTKTLNENDILFVLISGGGSALLPLPCNGVALSEKLETIKKLANKGATITDINRVRIDLSQTKGGKLSHCARNAGTVISFIISDIVGDPIDLIASGPTVIQSKRSEHESSVDVLRRYGLWTSLPERIQKIISENAAAQSVPNVENAQNIIIANNEIAVNSVMQKINSDKLIGIILSTEIQGNVAEISDAYFNLCKSIDNFKYGKLNENEFREQLAKLREVLNMREDFLKNIVQIVNQSKAEQIDLCVIGAGEPTVEVTGSGIGGRNQELALRFSQLSFDDNLTQDVLLLSAGTDGIDGKW